MRKLLYYFHPSVSLAIILFILIITAAIVNGCATLSLKAPSTPALIQDIAYETGNEI